MKLGCYLGGGETFSQTYDKVTYTTTYATETHKFVRPTEREVEQTVVCRNCGADVSVITRSARAVTQDRIESLLISLTMIGVPAALVFFKWRLNQYVDSLSFFGGMLKLVLDFAAIIGLGFAFCGVLMLIVGVCESEATKSLQVKSPNGKHECIGARIEWVPGKPTGRAATA
jgi:hypothetical protein